MLGVSTRTIYNLRVAGELSAVLIGRKVIYAPADLRALIARKKDTR
jgi:hypothetical protein